MKGNVILKIELVIFGSENMKLSRMEDFLFVKGYPA